MLAEQAAQICRKRPSFDRIYDPMRLACPHGCPVYL